MLRSNVDLIDLLIDPLGWDKGSYRFDRWEKDMNPYSVKYDKEAEKVILSHNILGIDKNDLSITTNVENGKNYLVIAGKTIDKITGKEYSINSRFCVSNEYDTDKLEAEAKNGLVYITIPYKKEAVKDKTKTFIVK